MTDVTTNANGNKSIKMTATATANDWINRIVAEHATTVTQEAVEAKPAVKGDDGKITEAAVRARAEKTALSEDALSTLANINSLELKDSYPNIGMKRMALSNKMRAAAKRRGGLMLPTGTDGAADWHNAPDDFETNEKITENPDGTKIAPEAPAEAPAEA